MFPRLSTQASGHGQCREPVAGRLQGSNLPGRPVLQPTPGPCPEGELAPPPYPPPQESLLSITLSHPQGHPNPPRPSPYKGLKASGAPQASLSQNPSLLLAVRPLPHPLWLGSRGCTLHAAPSVTAYCSLAVGQAAGAQLRASWEPLHNNKRRRQPEDKSHRERTRGSGRLGALKGLLEKVAFKPRPES